MSGQTNENKTAIPDSSVHSYHLTLFSDADEICELWLPKIPEGFFRFSNDPQHRFLSITAKNGQWFAECKKPAFFKEVPLANSYEIPLSDGELIKVSVEERSYLLLAERVVAQRSIFRNYDILPDVQISIGSQPDCDIYYRGPFVSRKHAVISRVGGRWVIKCLDGLYGMFINGEKRAESVLNLGDVVYLMGLKILVGQTHLAINSGLGEVAVNPAILQDDAAIHGSHSRYYEADMPENTEKFFNRAPRKRRDTEQKTIVVDGPPMSMNQKQMPLMLRMGSSMVMGGAAAMAGNFMTLITSVMFPFLSSKYTDNQRQEYEKLRLEKYTQYLNKKKQEIEEAIVQERRELNSKYPRMDRLTEREVLRRHLWERRPVDSDFLQLRLGTGTRPLSATIDHPPRNFELEPDALEEKMFELVEKSYTVDDAPIVLALKDTYICGVEGDRRQVVEFVRDLTLQAAMLHSYDEVKMVFLLSQEDMAQLDDIRYLPHVWDDHRTTRFIATNEAEAYAVGEYIKGEMEQQQENEKDLQKILKNRPFYIVFALDKKAFDAHEVFKQLLQADTNPGAAVISAHNNLPKESQKIINLQSPSKNICTTMGVDGGEDEVFAIDPVSQRQAKQVMRQLANTVLKQADKAQAMPKMVTFLEMFKVGRIEQLNPLKRWRENSPIKSLATPVGVGEDGSLFMLDLHEKRQGPHGLVAGMTGSGKSEFIITYILSMAVNYHPDEVSFVLIDYKGGGLADAFENPRTGVKLPHLAGTITNLDGASIQRSLMSIESELVRRQKVFSDVSKNFDEGSMNIYTYQKLYRAGKVSEPMPHLFIISDEFAELKQQQPEFMDKLISAARIGRSLGVHLILATQKPSGVVNDQIRSNTKFRVCLRVQERSDSQDMLKRPEAAELTDTGRFYLQVGYNEYFALGQSAWCGAAYEPQDTVPVQRDDAVEFLDITGQVVAQTKPKVKKTDSGMKQIGAVVQYLSNLAERENTKSRSLWQPELPKLLDLRHTSICNGGSCNNPFSVCLGLMDDPVNQAQKQMVVDFSQIGNTLIVGSSGSGKTTFIQNALYALSKQLSPEFFNFYILDYSSRRLKVFQKLPHCGAVLYEEDSNSLDAFFILINEILLERKELFSKLEVDSFELAHSVAKIPLVLVVIDNFAGLTGSKRGENLSYQMPACMRECSTYGIKFIITCSHSNEVSSKIRQTMDTRYCFRAKDRYEYSDVLNVKVAYVPPEIPGRGLFIDGVRPLEFQMGTYWANMNSKDQNLELRKEMLDIKNDYLEYEEARHLPVVNEKVSYSEFAAQFAKGRIPLGFSKATGKHVALPLKQYSTLSIYFGNPQGKKNIIENLLFAASREKMELWVVRQNGGSLFQKPEDVFDANLLKDADFVGSSTDDISMLHNALASVMTQRREIIQSFCREQGIDPEHEDANLLGFTRLCEQTKPIMVIIENLSDFVRALNPILSFGYSTLFGKTNWRNIYVVACLEPGAPVEVAKNEVFSLLSEQNVLLFGGQYDKQQLCPIPVDPSATKQLPFNAAIMQYQKKLYPIVMPCGTIEGSVGDKDMESIF